MGQIADDMIDGRACELCGCYFVDIDDNMYEHGYPATCSECWRDLTEKEKEVHQLANTGTA